MSNSFTATGTYNGERTITLAQPLQLGPVEVRVHVEPIQVVEPSRKYHETMEKIRARQAARGHVPPTREEVDERIRSLRAEWDDV